MLLSKKFGVMFLMLFNVACSFPVKQRYNNNIRRLIDLIQRRTVMSSDESILGVPESEEDLPVAEPIQPGHTLLQPSFGMLKSAVKYSHKDVGGPVYGNLANLGITYGKTNQRVLNTGFRKANDLLYKLLQDVPRYQLRPKKSNSPWVVIELDPVSLKKKIGKRPAYEEEEPSNTNNNAMEIFDDDSLEDKSDTYQQSRRQRIPRKSKYRDRGRFHSSESASVSSSKSSDYERNPGNPYTVHKDKYKQNWLWNHFMDGNHMNVNPYAPSLNSMGPSGAALFFGRKWWYFNQDDFKPLH